MFEAHKGKVFSLNWTHDISRGGSNQLLFSCGPDGEVVGYCLGVFKISYFR